MNPNDGEQQCEDVENYGVSLHALRGTHGVHTLKLGGQLMGRKIHILIDTGSLLNFISQSLLKSIKISTKMSYTEDFSC